MGLLKYNELFSINESALELSKTFVNLLTSMKSDKIASKILELYYEKKDLNFLYNFIDITDKKDTVSFTPDKKAVEYITTEPEKKIITYEIKQSGRLLTNNTKNQANQRVFQALEFTPKQRYDPPVGTKGTIKKEYTNPGSANTYVHFVSSNGRETVLNKEAFVEAEDDRKSHIWKLFRNSIKIGRIAKSIIESTGEKISDKDVENFVNLFKSHYDVLNNSLGRFEVVTGKKIAHWYKLENYQNNRSTLGNSCMSSVPSKYFDIYVKNPKAISLLILYAEGGEIKEGKYTHSKICGRAIVWNTNEGDIFIDRIYTNFDSDIELFKQYAQTHDLWYKTRQETSDQFSATNGKQKKSPIYTIKLEKSEFDEYPYLDTMMFLNTDKNIISNDADTIGADRRLSDTGGGYDNYGDDYDEDYYAAELNAGY